jgi:hypothetical protein
MSKNPHYKTPAEMSQLVCPAGVGSGIPGREIKMSDGVILGKPCISRHCAAWRWIIDEAEWNEEEEDYDYTYSTTHGYCGMVNE